MFKIISAASDRHANYAQIFKCCALRNKRVTLMQYYVWLLVQFAFKNQAILYDRYKSLKIHVVHDRHADYA
jgi:hypothetical protein